MMKKTPVIWLIAGLVTALAIIISGCSTKKPWATNPNPPLEVSLISGPSDSLSVPLGSVITYTWTYSGGQGAVQYQYKVDTGEFSTLSKDAVTTIRDLSMGLHTFSIQAEDETGATSLITATFRVVEVSIPTVVITDSPAESTSVATGSTISFTWQGNDATTGADYMLYQYSFAGVTSDWVPTLTATFTNVEAANPAVFIVTAKDLAGNLSASATVSFVIMNANIMYVDDYLWLDSFGEPDRAKERDQKAFYREALKGYAVKEWDNDAQGLPTLSDLAGITTIIWAADANVCAADPNYRLYYDIGAEGGGVLKDFLDIPGNHLIITGSQVLNYVWNTIPPASTDFEAKYLGVSDTMITVIDTTVVPPDTSLAPTWVSPSDFTWAIKAAGSTLDLPDSMKIDVAKNGTQSACDASLVYLKSGVTPLFTVGLDVAGDPPPDHEMVTGWMYQRPGDSRPISASLMFDTYSMPGPGMKQTFHTILDQFGEGPGL